MAEKAPTDSSDIAEDHEPDSSGPPTRLSETQPSLEIYRILIDSDEALSASAIQAMSGIKPGTMYPILQKRSARGLILTTQVNDVMHYELTDAGMEIAVDSLERLRVRDQRWKHIVSWRRSHPRGAGIVAAVRNRHLTAVPN